MDEAEKRDLLKQVMAEAARETLKPSDEREYKKSVRSVDEVGKYTDEEHDEDVLIYGPWLERGGSAFWVSTSGTGKSTSCMQFVHCASAGIPFCGLKPRGKLRFWVFQSEDSPRRVAQDREDVRAELAEQYPEVDWATVGKTVKFVDVPGVNGTPFLDALDRLLGVAALKGEKPDVVVLNPLLAFIGGAITDGKYVTPFLRGGEINGHKTIGLQAILGIHKVGVLVYHHTPKPPTEKELDAWMASPFPEYQGAGSSDLTNWGRSFVTMMRVKGHPGIVCVTAGKNGAELGWEKIDGAYRRYMAFSDKIGVSGKTRHAWRDLTPEEYDEIVGKQKSAAEKKMVEVAGELADAIAQENVAVTKMMLRERYKASFTKREMGEAIPTLFTPSFAAKYHLRMESIYSVAARGRVDYVGPENAMEAVRARIESENEVLKGQKRKAVAPIVDNKPKAVEPSAEEQRAAEAALDGDDYGIF